MTAAREILASGSELEVTRLVYRAGDGAKPHFHDHEQVGWVVSGLFRLTADDVVTLHGAGSAYVVPARSIHTFEVLEPGIVYIVASPKQRTLSG